MNVSRNDLLSDAPSNVIRFDTGQPLSYGELQDLIRLEKARELADLILSEGEKK